MMSKEQPPDQEENHDSLITPDNTQLVAKDPNPTIVIAVHDTETPVDDKDKGSPEIEEAVREMDKVLDIHEDYDEENFEEDRSPLPQQLHKKLHHSNSKNSVVLQKAASNFSATSSNSDASLENLLLKKSLSFSKSGSSLLKSDDSNLLKKTLSRQNIANQQQSEAKPTIVFEKLDKNMKEGDRFFSKILGNTERKGSAHSTLSDFDDLMNLNSPAFSDSEPEKNMLDLHTQKNSKSNNSSANPLAPTPSRQRSGRRKSSLNFSKNMIFDVERFSVLSLSKTIYSLSRQNSRKSRRNDETQNESKNEEKNEAPAEDEEKAKRPFLMKEKNFIWRTCFVFSFSFFHFFHQIF